VVNHVTLGADWFQTNGSPHPPDVGFDMLGCGCCMKFGGLPYFPTAALF
jgi:hypothetical protein